MVVATVRNKPKFFAGPLLLILAALAAVVVYMRRLDVESYLSVQTERSIPLLLHLDEAVQASGFPRGQRFMMPLVFKDPATKLHENIDDPGIAIPTTLNGEVVFPHVPVHAGASLKVGFGVELVTSGGDVPITFSVSVRRARDGVGGSTTASKEELLLSEELRAPAPGAPPLRVWSAAKIPAGYHGTSCDLVFRTRSTNDLPDGALYPAILSPVVESDGVSQRLESLTTTHEVVVDDLLARYDAAIDQDTEPITMMVAPTPDTCFAVREFEDGREELVAIEPTVIDPAFQVDASAFAERGGAWPAIAFGWDGPIVRYSVMVPSEGDPRLRFAIGIDERALGVGAATFGVLVDGASVFTEELDPVQNEAAKGWHERTVDLKPFAGRKVIVEFHGTTGSSSPRALDDRLPADPADPLGTPYKLHVKRVRAGFARPRIVVDQTVRSRHSKRGERRSVIVVNVETLRADALGCYGGVDGISPAIDRLALDGTRVEQCISSSSWTAPSVASLFTGLYPQAHGVRSYSQSYLADAVWTLAEAARDDGVRTAAFVTNSFLSPRRNFDQGFDDYLCCPEANARQIVATFTDWLQNHRELQFFAYLHLFEPHDRCDAPGDDRERYVPERLRGQNDREVLGRVIAGMLSGRPPEPDDDDVQFLRGRYFGEIRYLDRQIERLRSAVEAAGLKDRVVIILTSDHGEEFGEHGLVGHGCQLYGETVQVPLIFFGDGVPAGRILKGPVENRRIFGAVLDFLGAPRDPEQHDGFDLSASNVGGRAYSVTEQGILRMPPPELLSRSIHLLRNNKSALHYSPRGRITPEAGGGPEEFPSQIELYRLDLDPEERQNRAADGGELLAGLKADMRKAHRNATTGSWAGLPRAARDALKAELAALGYLGGTATDEDELFDEDESESSDE